MSDEEPRLLKIDGHDNAIMGIVDGVDTEVKLCYDTDIILENLVKEGMTYDEAQEFFCFNISGAYMGTGTPCFLREFDEDEW